MAKSPHARIEVSLELPDYAGRVQVQAVRGFEEVSRGFEYAIDVQAEDLELDALRAQSALVTIEGPHGVRHVHGMIVALEVLGLEASRELDLYSYRITLRPRVTLLGLRHGYRVFQNMSVIDIAEKVFADAGLASSAYEVRAGSYPKREYCVQYDESEWAFLCRLFEEEGLYFAFEHAPDTHVMVIADQSKAAPAMEPAYLPFDLVGGLEGRLCARSLTVAARARIDRVTLSDCHPLRPSTPLSAHEHEAGPFAREHYEYPSGCVDASRQKQLARIRLDEALGAASVTRVRSNAIGATAGTRVTLDGHPTSEDGELFVRSVRTEIVLRAPDGAERGAVCDIDLELSPAAIPFRPERLTPRPRVAGVQSARITGPRGEEVSFDDHGRVTLQFHWDRDGKLDEKSSCPVPVAQGHTTGSMAMPRIGWEVLVDFIDGNPDRPVCLGRLYNAFYPPPSSLPDHKTVSMLRSDSVGGEGYNQLLFDDRAGAERFELHAQYDLAVAVANDKEVQVEHAAQHAVGLARTVTVGGNETQSFAATLTATVKNNQEVTVGANRTMTIDGLAIEQTAGNFTRSVGAAESITVGTPGAALLSLLTSAAIEGAVGAAAKAAERMGARALGPLVPALGAARDALGGAVKLAGPAAALLSGGDPKGSALAGSIGLLADAHASVDVQSATAMAVAAASAELAPKVSAAVRGGAGDVGVAASATGGPAAGGGAGAGAAGASASAAPAAAGGGSGNLTTTVTGNVTETVGGLVAVSSAQAISQGIGGNRVENIGAARIETVRGGVTESTGAAKSETVGVYTVKAEDGIVIDAGAAASITIDGDLKQTIGGSHTLGGKATTSLKTKKLKLKAKTSVAFICGMAKIVVDSSGILFFGLQKIDIEGNDITLDPVDIGPG